jgi:predicted SnoaL-like aldol condensation-catalyzing enzyme
MATKRIFKYTIPCEMIAMVEMPGGAEILSVQVQDDYIQAWAIVDPSKQNEKRYFEVAPTGATVPNATRKFISTVQIGDLVFHVFELLSLKQEVPHA